ncbi:MAG: DUF1501 domain-containing protein [Betaproteobacteria bacterium]|nr:DUF1501 domain-containing protein [Betaproteobacteria bacterium]
MKRRDFIRFAAVAPVAAWCLPSLAAASRRLLILVELKGGNDGFNTVVPFADPAYARLRPRLALPRESLLEISETAGLHPSLEKLLPLWNDGGLAIVQGVGYPAPNLSHFRSIEIWDTASRSDEYLDEGWLTRFFAKRPSPPGYAADGVVVGSADLGPLAGTGARTIALANPEQFLRSARLAKSEAGASSNPSLAHILRVEHDILLSAERLKPGSDLGTSFPAGPFGAAIRTAVQLAANPEGVSVIRVTLNGFDTHANQLGTHAGLLRQLGEGLAALREGLLEVGRWNDALVATYAEFGRRPRENESRGTDHGTAAAHFVMGGPVKGGWYGAAPRLDSLDASGNPAFTVDFRSLYSTLLEGAWSVETRSLLGGQFDKLGFVQA